MDVVIIGGVAGGMSAATRLRRLDESARITVIERGGYVSFANCGLPYHVGGVIEERDALLLQTPASLARAVPASTSASATRRSGIDRRARTVRVCERATGREADRYDALLLSPGARPVRPPIPGIDRALALRTVEDLDALVAAAGGGTQRAWSSAAGSSAWSWPRTWSAAGSHARSSRPTDQVLAPLDPEMAEPVHRRLHRRRVGPPARHVRDRDRRAGRHALDRRDRAPPTWWWRPSASGPRRRSPRTPACRSGPAAASRRRAVPDQRPAHLRGRRRRREARRGRWERDARPARPDGEPAGPVRRGRDPGRPARDRGVLGTAIVGVFGLHGRDDRLEREAAARRRPRRTG